MGVAGMIDGGRGMGRGRGRGRGGGRGRGAGKTRPVTQRIRDIKRLLNKPDLDQTIRVSQERILKALELEKAEKGLGEVEKKHQAAYKRIKFFEERKLVRWLAAAEKLLEAAAPGAMQSKQQAEVDSITKKLRYIEEFPRSEKYISILKEDGEMDVATLRKREEIFAKIESDKSATGGLKALARTIGAGAAAAALGTGGSVYAAAEPDGIEADAFFAPAGSTDHIGGDVDFGDDGGEAAAAAEAETAALVETALEKRKVKKSKKGKKDEKEKKKKKKSEKKGKTPARAAAEEEEQD